MPILKQGGALPTIDAATLADWADIPPAIASDCMNRSQTMDARITPIAAGTTLVGRARTVQCMVGDNGALHAIIRLIEPGDVLVVDAGGFTGAAVWGGLLTRSAMVKGAAGIVLDGAARDVAEMRELGFACFSAGTVPAGPHKGFGGTIDGPIACGGCPVRSGDLVLGDDDGVAVVPHARIDEILAASRVRLADEEAFAAEIANGLVLADRFGIGSPEKI